ncbi:MAG: GTP-binding protein [Cryobacterium sp.]|nr:GTP-binding protein [Cryobacterium sp.]
MSASGGWGVAELLSEAVEVYRDDPVAKGELEEYARRLDEPLRVAIAGMVKAGKSTLLNAIIGEEIAPTDAGECTRVVTWYRYGNTPQIMLHPHSGPPRSLPVKRVDGRLVFDMGVTSADEVDRLVVDWPAKSLRTLTLIDTPGIASLSGAVSQRSTDFLTPEDAPSEADAIVYLLRHLHACDLTFLDSFRDTAAGKSASVNALAVLSRADEIGGGRVDSLLSARDIAGRYRRDTTLRSLALGVVPIAGLLAQSARTLRHSEFTALVQVAELERDERERLLISADRFVRSPQVAIDSGMRSALLTRYGLFGIRLAAVLIRSGVREPTRLAHELSRRSGLDELLDLIAGQFQSRAEHLKARTALAGAERVLRMHPRPGTERLIMAVERIHSSAHEFRELRLLATARTTGLDLPSQLAAEAERLLGGRGINPRERLGLDEDAPADEVRSTAVACLNSWRARAQSPVTNRAGAELCLTLVRTCEGILAQTDVGQRQAAEAIADDEAGVQADDAGAGNGAADVATGVVTDAAAEVRVADADGASSGGRIKPRLVLAAEPGTGPGNGTGYESHTG